MSNLLTLVKSLMIAVLILSSTQATGRDIDVSATSIEANIVVGTTTAFTGVAFDILLRKAIPENVDIDRAKFNATRNELPDFELRDEQDQIAQGLDKSKIAAARFHIQAEWKSGSIDEEAIKLLSKSVSYIHISRPLNILLTNGDVLIISPQELKKVTLETLSPEDVKLLINAKGGEHTLYQNKIDFGVRADKADSADLEFVLSFRYLGKPFELLPDWWKMYASGYLSTDKNDSLSELRIYPVSIGRIWGLNKSKPLATFEFRASLGVEGDQSLRIARFNANVHYATLFPNLTDLTGGANRLRLRPVIKLGIEVWREIDDNSMMQDNKTGGKFGGEIYYFVPILQNYSLLVEGDFGVPFGKAYKEKYEVDDFVTRFDLILGYHLHGGNMKVMAKYSLGENDIQYKNTSKLFLGLVIDFLKVNQGSLPALQ